MHAAIETLVSLLIEFSRSGCQADARQSNKYFRSSGIGAWTLRNESSCYFSRFIVTVEWSIKVNLISDEQWDESSFFTSVTDQRRSRVEYMSAGLSTLIYGRSTKATTTTSENQSGSATRREFHHCWLGSSDWRSWICESWSEEFSERCECAIKTVQTSTNISSREAQVSISRLQTYSPTMIVDNQLRERKRRLFFFRLDVEITCWLGPTEGALEFFSQPSSSFDNRGMTLTE